MAQTLVGNGIAVNFGFAATAGDYGITDSPAVLKGFLLQGVDYETGADKEDVRSLQGDIVARNHYDLHTKATLRFVIAGTSKAAAKTATTLSPFKAGTLLVVTACASHPDLVGTNLECQAGAKISGDVTKSATIDIPVEIRAGITAAQS